MYYNAITYYHIKIYIVSDIKNYILGDKINIGHQCTSINKTYIHNSFINFNSFSQLHDLKKVFIIKIFLKIRLTNNN